MGKVLTEEACREQYTATLDKLANISLFQYTFIATVNFIWLRHLTSFKFLELELSRTDWAFVSNIILAATNLYVCRHLRYLDKLVKLYPKRRRVFRFLAWNHTWLLNPFGRYRLRLVHLLKQNLLPYISIVALGALPGLYFLKRDVPQQQSDLKFWVTWGVAVAFATLNVYSVLLLLYQVYRHSNTLWMGGSLYFRWIRNAVHRIAGTAGRPAAVRPVLIRRKHVQQSSHNSKTGER